MPLELEIAVSPGRPPRGAPFVVPVFEGEAPEIAGLGEELAGRIVRAARRRSWTGGRDQVAAVAGDPPVTLWGLGPRDRFDHALLVSWLQKVTGEARRDVQPRLAVRPPIHPVTSGAAGAQAVCRLTALAGYRFDEFKSSPKPGTLTACQLVPVPEEVGEYRRAAPTARAVAGGVATARDLANTPPNRATPEWIASRARELAQARGLSARVLTPRELDKRGMRAVLAVGGGSSNGPRLVRLEWGSGERVIALVGKGVTFDSGGISIKPSKSMEDMKYDKSGACAVLGIAQAAAELDLPFRFRAYVPLAENMPSGEAYRPSDVVRCYNGKTVEVLNTDAEGRMILADALSWAAEEGADTLIEMSTLTGATVVALGHHGAALYTPHDGLADELLTAGADSGERLWRMPLWREFGEEMRGNHADLRNVAGRWGGANAAAAFLGEFVGEVERWAHLDIAGTAYVGSDGSGPAGATGFGVALVLGWLLRQAGRL